MVRSWSLKGPSLKTDSRRGHSSDLSNDWILYRWQRGFNIQCNPKNDQKIQRIQQCSPKKEQKCPKFNLIRVTFWRRLVRYSREINEIVAWTLDCQISNPYLGVRWTDQAARERWRWTSPSRKYYRHQFRNSL